MRAVGKIEVLELVEDKCRRWAEAHVRGVFFKSIHSRLGLVIFPKHGEGRAVKKLFPDELFHIFYPLHVDVPVFVLSRRNCHCWRAEYEFVTKEAYF